MPLTQISHYHITRKIGAGTYGEVYEGVHVHDPELKVAVKRVTQALAEDPRFVESLKKECRQLDRMDHPNIVRFRELVVSDLGVSMVLELLEGQDLHDRLAGGPIALETTLDVIEAILEGLAYAHARGVMHRDIKPSNVYWCDDGRIKLLDFGIARAADGTQATKTGHIVGTLDYMAPERFDARGGNLASDVYAVGLIAWELLAGRAACPDGEFGRKLAWHLTQGVGDAAKVAATLRGCPPWFAEVIALLATKLPEERPVDGAAALALLRAKRPANVRSGEARRPPPATVMGPGGSGPPVVVSAPPQRVLPQSVPPVERSAPPKTVVGPDFPAPVEADVPSPVRPSTPVSWFVPMVVGLLSFGAVVLLLTGDLGWLAVSGGGSTPVVIPSLPSLDSPTLGKFVCLPEGTFQMGSPSSEAYRDDDETPHSVTVSSFCMMESEVTQGAWEAVMGSNPVANCTFGASKPCSLLGMGDNFPVINVSWKDIQVFIQKVSARDHVQYRLPTEAEWEYAACGGQSGLYAGTQEVSKLCTYANVANSARKSTYESYGYDVSGWVFASCDDGYAGLSPVKSLRANSYGLYDMSGNVWEWVSDWYGDYKTSGSTFKADSLVDPLGNVSGSARVSRGGSWGDYPGSARVANRYGNSPSDRGSFLGFRLSRTIP